MKMSKMKMLLLITLCLYTAVSFAQGGARISVKLKSIQPDTLVAYDGDDVYYAKAGKDGKFVFQLKPKRGPRDFMLVTESPKRSRMAMYMNDHFNLEVITNLDDSISFSGAGEV